MELTIDKRIQAALHPLTHDEFKTLEANCLAAGRVRDKIKVWNDTGIIIDGHHRYKIAKKHGLEFDTEVIALDSIDDVMIWIFDNQFGRRNLSSVQLSMARAQRAKLIPDTSREQVAASLGVTDRQLRTDTNVQRAVEEMPDNLRERLSVSSTQKELARLAQLPEDVKKDVYEKLSTDETIGLGDAMPTDDKSRHGLRKGDLDIVDEHFDPEVRRMVRHGSLRINSKEISKVMALADVKRQLVFDMLTLEEVATVAEAIELATEPKKSSPAVVDLPRLASRFDTAVAKAVDALDSYARAKGTYGSPVHTSITTQLNQAIDEAKKL